MDRNMSDNGNSNISINSNSNDMVTTLKTFLQIAQSFSGTEDEDATKWFNATLMQAKILNLNKTSTTKGMLFLLQNQALNWATHNNNNQGNNITLETFQIAFLERFTNQISLDKQIGRFLKIKTTSAHKEFIKLLRDATFLARRECIQHQQLIKWSFADHQ
ncbi:hypothetical protein ENBRE01_2545 [Enteropsectra breve]|nr:hypothetical protein ENBRE01_2545 [Enteropsectra breve]